MRHATLALALVLAIAHPLSAAGLTADVAGGLGDDAGFRGGLSYWSDGGWGFGGTFEDLDQGDVIFGSPLDTNSDFLDLWIGWMSDEGWGVQGGYFDSSLEDSIGGFINGDGFYGRVFFAGPVEMGEDTEAGWFDIGVGYWTADTETTGGITSDGDGLLLSGMIWIPFGDGWGGYAQGNLGWEADDFAAPATAFNVNPQRLEGGITYEFSAGWVGYVAWREIDFGLGSGWAAENNTADGIWIGLHIMPQAWETEGMESADY